MNRIFASFVGVLNGLLIFAFLVIGPAVGSTYFNEALGGYGGWLGFVVGLILAVIVCGLLAIFTSILDEVTIIRELLSKSNTDGIKVPIKEQSAEQGFADDQEAVMLTRLSAEQGNADAQYNVGLMYYQGLGVVPQDNVSAHMWFNLSDSNGNEDAKKLRIQLENEMTPKQIEKAQRMARNWKPKK